MKYLLGLLLVTITYLPSLAQSTVWSDIPLEQVSKINLPPEVLGDSWKPSPGVRIDDLTSLNPSLNSNRELLEGILKSNIKGIVSVADYTLVTSSFPLNTVTVRVFIFENPNQCEEMFRSKYTGEEWQKLDVENVAAFRNSKSPKLAAAIGRAWITAHQIQNGDEYIKATRHIIEKLTRNKRSFVVR